MINNKMTLNNRYIRKLFVYYKYKLRKVICKLIYNNPIIYIKLIEIYLYLSEYK